MIKLPFNNILPQWLNEFSPMTIALILVSVVAAILILYYIVGGKISRDSLKKKELIKIAQGFFTSQKSLGFNSTDATQPNFRNINPSYNQAGQEGTFSFWMRIPPTTNNLEIRDQIIFTKGSQEQTIKLHFNEKLKPSMFRVPFQDVTVGENEKVVFTLKQEVIDKKSLYKEFTDNLVGLSEEKPLYIVFTQAPNIVFKIVSQDETDTRILNGNVENVTELPPNSYHSVYNDYVKFVKYLDETATYPYFALFSNDPSKASLQNDEGYYSVEYEFLSMQPQLKFGKTKGDLVLYVDTKYGGTKEIELISSEKEERMSKIMQDGNWHLYTIVYTDYFGDDIRKSLRTGSNITFFIDGKQYKDFNTMFKKDYFKHNDGNVYLFPPQQELQYVNVQGLPKGAIATSETNILLNNVAQKFFVEFSNFFYWNYALEQSDIKQLYKQGHDPKAFEEYQKDELKSIYGAVKERNVTIPIVAYTS